MINNKQVLMLNNNQVLMLNNRQVLILNNKQVLMLNNKQVLMKAAAQLNAMKEHRRLILVSCSLLLIFLHITEE